MNDPVETLLYFAEYSLGWMYKLKTEVSYLGSEDPNVNPTITIKRTKSVVGLFEYTESNSYTAPYHVLRIMYPNYTF